MTPLFHLETLSPPPPVRTHLRKRLQSRLHKRKRKGKTLWMQFRSNREWGSSIVCGLFPLIVGSISALRTAAMRRTGMEAVETTTGRIGALLWWLFTVRLEVIVMNADTVVAFYCILSDRGRRVWILTQICVNVHAKSNGDRNFYFSKCR